MRRGQATSGKKRRVNWTKVLADYLRDKERLDRSPAPRESDDFDSAVGSLIEALDTDLDWVRAHTRLLVRANEWDNSGRNGE